MTMRWLLLIFVAIITFGIILLVNNPDLVHKFWLWVIGLAGVIVELLKQLWALILRFFTWMEQLVKKNNAPHEKVKKA